MKAFLILFVIAATLLGLSQAACDPNCLEPYNPQCGVSHHCLVQAANPCDLRFKACLLNLHLLPPIIDVFPGICPNTMRVCRDNPVLL